MEIVSTFWYGYSFTAGGAVFSFTAQPTFNPKTPIRIKSIYCGGVFLPAGGGLPNRPLAEIRVVMTITNGSNVFDPLDNLAGTAPTAANPAWYFPPSQGKFDCDLLFMGGQVITLAIFGYDTFALNDSAEVSLYIEFERVEGLNL